MAMFKLGDNVIVSDCVTPQSGQILSAQAQIGNISPKIFMDVRNEIIPDGQTAYFFGNKIIITVHWSDFSEEDDAAVNGEIKLSAGLNYKESGLFMFVKFGNYRWGDILIQPGLMSSFNDPSKAFDEIAFVFVDSNDGKMRSVRVVPITGELQKFFAYGDFVSYKYFHNSGYKKQSYKSVRELYDDWSKASMATRMWLLQEDPAELSEAPGMVNAIIDKDNNIRWSQNN